ncbi:hypothetical protein GCM10007886_33910 [Methylobacterium gregans]|nr:hypothetical protein GCM10007886_33910 [Methylobacterium gregans]
MREFEQHPLAQLALDAAGGRDQDVVGEEHGEAGGQAGFRDGLVHEAVDPLLLKEMDVEEVEEDGRPTKAGQAMLNSFICGCGRGTHDAQ